jgi:hypothetical protein
MLTAGEGTNVRFVANEKPDLNAEACEPNAEDAYMLCLHKSRVETYKPGGEK